VLVTVALIGVFDITLQLSDDSGTVTRNEFDDSIDNGNENELFSRVT
jgi:hypothetical protein